MDYLMTVAFVEIAIVAGVVLLVLLSGLRSGDRMR
jgi:hypothetical protein